MFKKFAALAAAAALSLGVMTGCGASGTTADSTGYSAENPLVLTLALVIGVIVLVMFVVIPELTTTVLSLGKTIRAFVPEAQRFLEDLFTDNSEVRAWLDGLNLDIGKMALIIREEQMILLV